MLTGPRKQTLKDVGEAIAIFSGVFLFVIFLSTILDYIL